MQIGAIPHVQPFVPLGAIQSPPSKPQVNQFSSQLKTKLSQPKTVSNITIYNLSDHLDFAENRLLSADKFMRKLFI